MLKINKILNDKSIYIEKLGDISLFRSEKGGGAESGHY